MLLHLLRHAEAEAAALVDDERRLTEAGRKRMKSVARAIASMKPGYRLVLVSPLVRARETAEAVIAACGYRGEVVVTEALRPGAPPRDVLEELARLSPGSALLVGHLPHLGRLMGRLLAGRDGLEVPMKKAALAVFETGPDPSAGRAELQLYLPARILETLP